MATLSIEAQQKLYDALKKIAREFQSPDQLRRNAERDYGLSVSEALEMAYENIQTLAADTIRGVRRPKQKMTLREQHGPR